MSDEGQKGRQLGRGLSALFGEESADYASLDSVRETKQVPIEFLRPNRYQPRKQFDPEEIESLAASIREHGIIQPLLVRRDDANPNGYEIVAGERRWRAAQTIGLHEVPIVIKELTDAGALEIALIENIQRENLNAIEEAEGYQRLMEEFDHTQERLAEAVGKSRSHVANTLRLNNLPADVKKLVVQGDLSAGHARALLGADAPSALAKKIVRRGLSVRQTEKLVQKGEKAADGAAAPTAKDADTLALENDLSNLLGLRVSVRFHKGGGELIIHYKSVDQLDDVLYRLGHTAPPAGNGD